MIRKVRRVLIFLRVGRNYGVFFIRVGFFFIFYWSVIIMEGGVDN